MMTLRDSLLKKVPVDSYVKIYDGDWFVAMCYVDDEDLFIKYMDDELLNREVDAITIVGDTDFTTDIYDIYLK